MSQKQKTIQESVSISGLGLFSGHPVNLTFKPAPPNHGIVFVRTDLGSDDGVHLPALVNHVVRRARRTTLKTGVGSIDTCEHCMSAVAARGVDNLIIEMDGPEVPGMDGSSLPFLEAIDSVGYEEQDAEKLIYKIEKPIVVRQGDAMIAAVPSACPGMEVVYDMDYPPPIGRQLFAFDPSRQDYAEEIAPARTYCLEEEAIALQESGLATHLTVDDALVIGPDGPLGTNSFRFENEPVRHKIVDLIGDLALLGAQIHGKIISFKSGHHLNHQLVRALIKHLREFKHRHIALQRPEVDIRKLARILPHRYPMLLVDRIIEIEPLQRAMGVKNVTINEPFFQGHYPGTPIMPGVLIVEAMAQLSGVLIGHSLEHTGKLAVLLSLDRVKLRKPVTPGDQLIIEAETVRIRARTAHMRCRAYVGEDLAAEAEIKFMLVDDEQD